MIFPDIFCPRNVLFGAHDTTEPVTVIEWYKYGMITLVTSWPYICMYIYIMIIPYKLLFITGHV